MDMFDLSPAQLEGAGWTAREILQQPQIWVEVESLIAAQSGPLASFLRPLLDDTEVRVVLTGAGTSAHIGACLAPALSRSLGRCVDAIPTTDLVASPEGYLSRNVPTLLVSFGRSGNSPESVAAVELTDSFLTECSHLIFTCDATGALYKRAQSAPNSYAIALPEKTNDRSFAMTSSFTGMLLAAALALGAVSPRQERSLPGLARRILPGSMPLLRDLVSRQFDRVVYLGSKEFQGLSRECALKMLEMTDGKVVAIADSTLGFRHGPKTFLNRNTLVVVYLCNDEYTRQYDLDLISELRREGVAGRIIAVSGRPTTTQHHDDVVLQTTQHTDVTDLELCLPYALLGQSLALLRSISLGVKPDDPNVAGTVSRVVKGVSIHPWRKA
jgi:tagatose-6-phosphate ketose/aldose isomerase